MAVLSTCRNFARVAQVNGRSACMVNLQLARGGGGHGHTMTIKPTLWIWNKTKDIVHFYALMALIPSWLFASYMNLTVGPAVLKETPPGYRPEWFEYHKHPVTRFLCKRVFTDPQHWYEQRLGQLNQELEKIMLNRVVKQVKNVMRARNDYEAWYFWSLPKGKYPRRMREAYYSTVEKEGYREPQWFRDKGWLGGTSEGLAGYQNPHGEGAMPDSRPPGLFKYSGKVERDD